MSKAKRKAYDWAAIEREYRAGQLSIREIARKHGTAPSSVATRAKRNGWKRDLTASVRTRTNAKLANANANTTNANDDEIIEAAADVGVAVITLQRKDIANLRSLEQKLIAEINGEPTKLYITQYQGEIVKEEVALTASERSAAAANLAQVQHKRIALERQAFNLDDDSASNALKALAARFSPATRQMISELLGDDK